MPLSDTLSVLAMMPDSAAAIRIAPERLGAMDHLRAIADGFGTGLLTFERRLEVRFANARLAGLLEIPPAVIEHAGSVLELLEASALLDEGTVQRLHEACLAAVDVAGGHSSAFSLQRAAKPEAAGKPQQEARFFALQITPLGDDTWMASFEETTDRRAAEAVAKEQAMCDSLTLLPNRELFHRRVEAALGADPPMPGAVMMIDLDRFKAVNDTLGHPVGDGLLRLVAKRLRAMLRAPDLVARLGGDEFALLVTSAADATAIALLGKRIVDVLGRPYLVDGHLVNIGASVGVALAPQDGSAPGTLLGHADLALYAAKNSGRSTCNFFSADMDVRALARRSLEIDLRKALALREFELHYQPQIDLERDQVLGFEALLRWRNPERGLLLPADFLPLAEEIGLIVPMGEWVLREAAVEAMRWPDTVCVAVNVSPQQFADTGRLVESVARALELSGLPGSRLEIELAESVLLRNEAGVLAALHRLREMGVRIAIDDFGTGYSSLSQLHTFPFDKIKIDRSFVNGQPDGDSGQTALVRAITALGASLGMATIAEGVETADQLLRIRAEGCGSVQGYLFSRPVPVDQIDDLIAAFSGREPPPAERISS